MKRCFFLFFFLYAEFLLPAPCKQYFMVVVFFLLTVSALHHETVFIRAGCVPEHSVCCPQSGQRTRRPLATVEGVAW